MAKLQMLAALLIVSITRQRASPQIRSNVVSRKFSPLQKVPQLGPQGPDNLYQGYTTHPPSTLHHHRDNGRSTEVWETSSYDQEAGFCNPVESPLIPFPSIYRTVDDIVGSHGPPISGQTVRR
ncbi:hypothetical protein CAPTEDRAFT_186004 [Capitella teleta]|uniref:Secreted protein n=1 Tax=Capitella teleta TaxID=283909 RepID=R7V4D8_CAPTE|nr:hypothetical protein CAPTEDRAFT_186004 [Capitella teleta]|eukprot:ELU13332.1 hypothetical protein CAPTEDRAFT_186004 [Capitella teleta]